MTTRSLLLSELAFIVRNCERLLGMLKPEHGDYRPPAADGVRIRSLLELANHIAQIPQVDMAIMRGLSEEEVGKLERDLWSREPKDLARLMREGLTELNRYMEQLSMSQFEAGSGTAYYGRTQTNCAWLLEVVTHLYHHRAQLFTYLKLLGYPVDTRTLYDRGQA
jgi:uncharacterized damage-inducible protein DinB